MNKNKIHIVKRDPMVWYKSFLVRAVAILASCIIECIKKKIQNFNLDVARGLLYCALSQLTCAEEPIESDFNKYASMLVDVYEAGLKEIG